MELVVRNGLNPLPQAPSVSAVAETMGYPPGVQCDCEITLKALVNI